MPVHIRLSRHGAKKTPIYWVVAVDKDKKRDGEVLEKLGLYLPKEKDIKNKFKVNFEATQKWLSKGALPTLTVAKLLKAALKK